MWDDQFESLVQQHQVIRYDVRGFGKSDLPTPTPYDHADDLDALLSFLGVDQVSVLGLSMGGWISAHFALNYPHRLRSLILADSLLIGHRWSSGWRERWHAIESLAAHAGVEAANAEWLDHPLFRPALENPAVGERLRQMITAYSGWHWNHSDTHRPIRPPDSQRLGEIRVPTLILLGERDLPDFHEIASTLQQGIAGARLVTLPGVGHMSNMESPAAFNRTVLEFLTAG